MAVESTTNMYVIKQMGHISTDALINQHIILQNEIIKYMQSIYTDNNENNCVNHKSMGPERA